MQILGIDYKTNSDFSSSAQNPLDLCLSNDLLKEIWFNTLLYTFNCAECQHKKWWTLLKFILCANWVGWLQYTIHYGDRSKRFLITPIQGCTVGGPVLAQQRTAKTGNIWLPNKEIKCYSKSHKSGHYRKYHNIILAVNILYTITWSAMT